MSDRPHRGCVGKDPVSITIKTTKEQLEKLNRLAYLHDASRCIWIREALERIASGDGELGLPTREPKTGYFNVPVPQDLLNRIDRLAHLESIMRADLLRLAVDMAIVTHPEPNPLKERSTHGSQ